MYMCIQQHTTIWCRWLVVIERKLNMFGHIIYCMLRDDCLNIWKERSKSVGGRSHTECLDVTTHWCGMKLHQLIELA